MSKLDTYRQKRNFKITSEPSGKVEMPSERLVFVVQRHQASRLHYDLRLEMEGVLKSWAVPKGPSLNPSDKRLAVMTEDHPIQYKDFEGIIPKGEYGAGDMVIWDKGYYEPLDKGKFRSNEKSLLNQLEKGSVKIVIYGEKLKGEFALVKLKTTKEENNWLLIKHKDEYAVSGKYDSEQHVEVVNEKAIEKIDKQQPTILSARTKLNGKKLSDFIKPMLATDGKIEHVTSGFVYEVKWDGYRAIAEIKKNKKLYSRNGLDFSKSYPIIFEKLQEQKHEMILDGEIVALDENGLPSFQLLQNYADKKVELQFQVFDLLWLNGHSTTSLSLLERKELLKSALITSDVIRFCEHVEGKAEDFFGVVEKNGLEGIIAKKKASTYKNGIRSTDWIKVKSLQFDDVYIAGYTKPNDGRKYFGSLVLANKQNEDFLFAGHAGTGFNDKSLKDVFNLLQPFVVNSSPLADKPRPFKPTTWVHPVFKCRVKYSEVTKDGSFRHPVFMGLDEEALAMAKSENGADKLPPSKPSQNKKKGNEVEKRVGGKVLTLTNQDKLYFPYDGITKGDVIDYYQKISKYILPYLKSRPLSLFRQPNGIKSAGFYQKDAPEHIPDWILTEKVYSDSNDKWIDYVVCNDVATLLYLANLGCIEMNPWNNVVSSMDFPDYLILDIDPGDKNTFLDVVEVALSMKQILDEIKIPGYPKTSGASGMHIYIPMGKKYSYDQVRSFAELICHKTMELVPHIATLTRSLSKREKGKIYLDFLQNRHGQTIASAYSLRPKDGATVSTPLEWNEVNTALHPSQFNIKNIFSRIEKKGDLFNGIFGKGIDILKAIDKLS